MKNVGGRHESFFLVIFSNVLKSKMMAYIDSLPGNSSGKIVMTLIFVEPLSKDKEGIGNQVKEALKETHFVFPFVSY